MGYYNSNNYNIIIILIINEIKINIPYLIWLFSNLYPINYTNKIIKKKITFYCYCIQLIQTLYNN